MGNEVEILMKDENRELSESLGIFIDTVLDRLNIQGWEFSVTLTDDEVISELNAQWRGKEGTTDVLTFVLDEGESFPEPEGLHHPGDILISLDQVERQAPDFEQSREKELKRVCVHGILHLKGMTHKGNDWSGPMLKLQEEILKETETVKLSGW